RHARTGGRQCAERAAANPCLSGVGLQRSTKEYSMDTLTSLAQRLGTALLASKSAVTTAESCTGGGIAEAITRVPGSSAWFEAGYVTYSNTQKTAQLDVPSTLFIMVGAVSREVVEAMARGAQRRSGARFA